MSPQDPPPPASDQAAAAGAFRHARSHIAVIAGVLTAAAISLVLTETTSVDCSGVGAAKAAPLVLPSTPPAR